LLALRAQRYDAVLLDIEMPRLDGFSLLAKIRADDDLRHLPVIMLTGHDDIASIDQAYQAGANSFAAKPVNWRQLSYHIRYVIRSSSMETAREARDNGKIGMSPRGVTPAAAREADEFLHAFIRRADALAERLSAGGLAQDGQIIHAVRMFAEQALAAHAALRPSDHAATAEPDRNPPATKRPPLGLAS
jgi:DNA-binding response OmpR family regulator